LYNQFPSLEPNRTFHWLSVQEAFALDGHHAHQPFGIHELAMLIANVLAAEHNVRPLGGFQSANPDQQNDRLFG
jgi:hypothetical protein